VFAALVAPSRTRAFHSSRTLVAAFACLITFGYVGVGFTTQLRSCVHVAPCRRSHSCYWFSLLPFLPFPVTSHVWDTLLVNTHGLRFRTVPLIAHTGFCVYVPWFTAFYGYTPTLFVRALRTVTVAFTLVHYVRCAVRLPFLDCV